MKSLRVNYYTSKSTTHYETDSRMKKKSAAVSISSKLGQHPDEAWGWEACAYPWSSPGRGSQSRVDVCPSLRGSREGGSRGEGERSRDMAMKSRQHAAAVELVIRPICPRTALICFLVQLAISGRRASIATGSHCLAQRRAISSGWLGMIRRVWNFAAQIRIGPWECRFIMIVRSKEPPERALVVPGQLQRTWA